VSLSLQDGGDSERPELDWRRSNPFLVLQEAFRAADYSAQDARRHAENAVNEMGLLPRSDGDPEVPVPLDWRRSNIALIVAEAFRHAGMDRDDATRRANAAVITIGAMESTSAPPELGYPMSIIFCEDGPTGPNKRRIERIMNGLCWEEFVLLCPTTEECTGGQAVWRQVTAAWDCDPELANLECVWILAGEPDWFPSSWIDIGCDCFVEVEAYDCFNIEEFCGAALAGPTGCPCD